MAALPPFHWGPKCPCTECRNSGRPAGNNQSTVDCLIPTGVVCRSPAMTPLKVMKKRQSGDRKQTKKSNILRFNVIKWNGLDPSALPCLDFSADSGLFKKPKKACSHLYETAARWYHAWISDFLPATLQQLPPWITGHGVPIYTVHWKNPKKKSKQSRTMKNSRACWLLYSSPLLYLYTAVSLPTAEEILISSPASDVDKHRI